MKNIKMPKELADKWLNALRSGKYQQGKDSLYQEREGQHYYCCLGALQMEVWGNTSPTPDHEELCSVDDLEGKRITFYSAYGGVTGDPFLQALGESASEANDHGRTFAEIADALEQEIEYTDPVVV